MRHYEKMIEWGSFSRHQLAQYLGNDATAGVTIQEYLRKGYIERIRRDRYAVISLETKQPILSRYQIGSSLFPDACISHHSAFEIYGYANQVFYETYVSSSSRFSDFNYNGIAYHRLALQEGTDTVMFNGACVTSIEQTVIDSIRDFEKVGGLEETLRCLLLIPSLNESKLLEVLKRNQNGFLYQKCGFVLQTINTSLGLSELFFEKCAANMANAKRSLMKDCKEHVWNPQWRLYVPVSILRMINKGVNDYDAV